MRERENSNIVIDDIILFATAADELRHMLLDLSTASLEGGMKEVKDKNHDQWPPLTPVYASKSYFIKHQQLVPY